VIVWMTFSPKLSDEYAYLRNPLHQNMIMVVGTLTIFLVGLLLTKLKRNKASKQEVVMDTH
jgi:SSS family solute:Na+ symporter